MTRLHAGVYCNLCTHVGTPPSAHRVGACGRGLRGGEQCRSTVCRSGTRCRAGNCPGGRTRRRGDDGRRVRPRQDDLCQGATPGAMRDGSDHDDPPIERARSHEVQNAAGGEILACVEFCVRCGVANQERTDVGVGLLAHRRAPPDTRVCTLRRLARRAHHRARRLTERAQTRTKATSFLVITNGNYLDKCTFDPVRRICF